MALKGKNILLVDDDLMFRALINRQLTILGFDTLELESGKQVVPWVNEHEIEAIVLDLMMDEQEGMETLTQLMALIDRPKVIVVSSNPDYLDIAMSIGADDKLIKPVRYEMLEMTLRKLVITA